MSLFTSPVAPADVPAGLHLYHQRHGGIFVAKNLHMSKKSSNFASKILFSMKKLSILFLLCIALLGFLLSACGNQSASNNKVSSKEVTKSEVQKKAEHFMNTKSDLLHECENLYAVYKNDKFRIYMSVWNDTPVDTIFKSDVYKILIERQEETETLSIELDEAIMQRMVEEKRLIQEQRKSSFFDDKFDSDIEALLRQQRHERDSINGIITRIKNQPDWNEPYWLIYEFMEDVDRTFAISGETDKSQYPCYCIYMPSTNELVTVVEKTRYSKPHVLKLLNKAL